MNRYQGNNNNGKLYHGSKWFFFSEIALGSGVARNIFVLFCLILSAVSYNFCIFAYKIAGKGCSLLV